MRTSQEIITSIMELAVHAKDMANAAAYDTAAGKDLADAMQGVAVGCLAALGVAVDGPAAFQDGNDLAAMVERGDAILNGAA